MELPRSVGLEQMVVVAEGTEEILLAKRLGNAPRITSENETFTENYTGTVGRVLARTNLQRTQMSW